jgi:hypothetical protein
MLSFRIQRELQMQEKEEICWIPKADWLLVAATLVALLLVILPIVALSWAAVNRLAAAACAASTIMIAGYVPSILAHYRLIFGRNRTGPRDNPEPSERFLIWLTALLAVLGFGSVLVLR